MEPVSKGRLAFLTSSEKGGTTLGMLNAPQGVGRSLGSPIAGVLWTTLRGCAAFYFAGTCAAAAAILLIPIFPRRERENGN